uniref:K Homology domain-containing protein n=1 Tax=Aegilops tauschii subsp. strangulata TaxID=200361 RepID=A0A453TES7_AEGTS
EFHVKKLGKLQNIGSLTEIIASGAKPNIKPKTPMRSPVNKDAQEESVTIAVADEHMGAVIGRGGRIINEISKVFLFIITNSQAKLCFSTCAAHCPLLWLSV